MNLTEAIESITYSSSWGIWAELDEEGKFSEDSDARFGQICFENGGILDGYRYFANGEHIQDFLWEWGGINDLIDAINASIEE